MSRRRKPQFGAYYIAPGLMQITLGVDPGRHEVERCHWCADYRTGHNPEPCPDDNQLALFGPETDDLGTRSPVL